MITDHARTAHGASRLPHPSYDTDPSIPSTVMDHRLPAGTALHILASGEGSITERIRRSDAAVEPTSDYVAVTSWRERGGQAIWPYRMPRGLKWTDFPVVLPPMWGLVHWRTQMRWRTVAMTMPDTRMADALSSAPVIVLHIDSSWSREFEADQMLPMLDLIERRSQVQRIVLVEDGRAEEWSMEDLKARYAWRLPHHRFLYNYELNFRAIAQKALLHALRTTAAEPSLDEVRTYAPPGEFTRDDLLSARIAQLEKGISCHVDHPMFLQILYRLHRYGPMPMSVEAGRGLARAETNPAWVPEEPWSREKPAPTRYLWRGTGLHPEGAMDVSAFYECAGVSGGLGVIARDVEGVCRITAAGERFLALIHPDMEDQDVLCRWSGRELTDDDAMAMDRWIMTKFRKTKTRVNRIGKTA